MTTEAVVPYTAPMSRPASLDPHSPPPNRLSQFWSWAKNDASDKVVTFVVNNSTELAALAADTASLLGVGESGAEAVKTSTPWFLRMFSPISSSYHLEKGTICLEEAFKILKQDEAMSETEALRLLDGYDSLLKVKNDLQDASPQDKIANRQFKLSAKAFLETTKRSSKEAQSKGLRRRWQDGRPSQQTNLGIIPELSGQGAATSANGTNIQHPLSDMQAGSDDSEDGTEDNSDS